jgi:hypothetical protein
MIELKFYQKSLYFQLNKIIKHYLIKLFKKVKFKLFMTFSDPFSDHFTFINDSS